MVKRIDYEVKENIFKKIEKELQSVVVNDKKMEIQDIWIESYRLIKVTAEEKEGKTVDFNVNFVFLGKDSNGLESIFACNCLVSGFLPRKEEEKQIDYEYRRYIMEPSVESIRDIDVVDLVKDAYDNYQVADCDLTGFPYSFGEVIYHNYNDNGYNYNDNDYEIIYRDKKGNNLHYLELAKDQKGWTPTRIISIDYFVEYEYEIEDEIEDTLYVHPNTYSPEFDLNKTPYFKLNAGKEDIETIKNCVKEMNDRNDIMVDIGCKKYRIVYRNEDLLMYAVDNNYRLVIDQNVMWQDEEGDISNILHENNYYSLNISGEIENVTEINFDLVREGCRLVDTFEDDKTYVKKCEKKTTEEIVERQVYKKPARDILIVNFKDGTQGFLFVDVEEEEEKKSYSTGAYTKKIIFACPKKNNENNKKD